MSLLGVMMMLSVLFCFSPGGWRDPFAWWFPESLSLRHTRTMLWLLSPLLDMTETMWWMLNRMVLLGGWMAGDVMSMAMDDQREVAVAKHLSEMS
ncbi:hypothetical protein TOPH_05924 [Tolypocladium ophioglossoides CBS 100239]|uniref:Secreted protein n=1 Tax=Tolypocladium ophioglossoides (strain CBS 100239) TaxID=1163406 RepID=A0A0L0N685_TOLOC|nr:hypothetical protein TOPH_05924 [Tolypocladium ophioglossoides CBS 100239]